MTSSPIEINVDAVVHANSDLKGTAIPSPGVDRRASLSVDDVAGDERRATTMRQLQKMSKGGEMTMDDVADLLDDRNKKVSGQKRKIFGLVLACIGIAAAFLGITIWANIITRQTEVKDSGVQTTPAGNPVGTAKVVKAVSNIMQLAATEAGMREVFEVETYKFQRLDNFSYHMKVTDRMVNSDYSNITLFGDRGISVQITRSSDPYATIHITDPTDPLRRSMTASEVAGLEAMHPIGNRRQGMWTCGGQLALCGLSCPSGWYHGVNWGTTPEDSCDYITTFSPQMACCAAAYADACNCPGSDTALAAAQAFASRL